MPELWKLDATAQAELVRSRELTPRELLDSAIDRIARLNPRINAVITPLYERAYERADAVDLGAPFAGVPLLVKDACLEIEGTPYYLGTALLRDMEYRSTRTSELSRRFERAGFVVAGKTNTPEHSSGITTEPRAFGATHNPWDLGRSPGGSSGGSAAAVAAGMAAMAHGGDGTGSLRYPAACCGVVTLKPTRGRMPHVTPGMPDPLGLWTEFVLARSVRDLAGVLDATHGAEPGDLFVAPRPTQGYADVLEREPGRLRIGLLTADVMSNMEVHPACVEAVRRSGTALETLGHDVEEAHPPALDGLFLRTYQAIMTFGVPLRYAQQRWFAKTAGRELRDDDFSEPLMSDVDAQRVSASAWLDALTLVEREMRKVHDWWLDGWDVLITPTLRQPAWPLGQNGGAFDSGVFPPPFSYTGQPAMSLPVHCTGDGLPVGVQIVAAYGNDDVALQVAAQLEQALPWRDRWPAIAAEA